VCKYGEKCYRKNPEHLKQFYHPPTSSSSSSSSTSSPQKSTTAKTEQSDIFTIDIKSLKWRQHESLVILDVPKLPYASKIAAFDMDGTLIRTKSGLVFAKSRADWEWLYPEVPKKLANLHQNGYRIIIFTNQNGISKGHAKADEIKGKIMDIIEALKIPIIVFIATDKDKYRKPRTSLWEYMIQSCNSGMNPSEAIFVGDAAGRGPDGKLRPKKDFSSSDRGFAVNIGIDFQTPEEYFLGHPPAPFKWDGIDPKSFLKKDQKLCTGDMPLTLSKQELVIFVGFPASGKSTFAKKYLIPKGYVHVNQDTLKSKDKCLSATKKALEEGKSVVVDNTNPSAAVRAEYMKLAKSKKITARCFWFNASYELANHMNKFREEQTNGSHKAVPTIGYNMYKSKFEEPTKEEGFVEVKKINFVPEFSSKQDEALFTQFL
jgi:bifunctional polynucleotide phosphatase/kinase